MNRMMTMLLLVLGCQSAVAQDEGTLTLDAQLRTRAEYRNGAVSPQKEDEKGTAFVNERARLSMQYDRGNLTLKASAQHTGVWGQDPQVDKQGRMTLNEAWARFKFDEGFFVQLGRQQLVYDDERLLGSLDWNVAGRWHDALRAGYTYGDHQVHAILAYNQNDEQTKEVYYDALHGQPYQQMEALWYHYDGRMMPLPFEVSLLFINLGIESGNSTTNTSNIKCMQTLGTYFNVVPPVDGLKVAGSFYYQMGAGVSAWMGSLKATYMFNQEWSAHVAYDYLSGEDGKGDKYSGFDPLYGTHHQFYGSMDLFYVPQYRLSDVYGLQDIQVGVQSKAIPQVPMQLTYHYFATAAKIQESILGMGHEFDYQLSYNIMKDVQLKAGYSVLFGQHTLDIVKGGDHKQWQDWGWISLNINPRIFSNKK